PRLPSGRLPLAPAAHVAGRHCARSTSAPGAEVPPGVVLSPIHAGPGQPRVVRTDDPGASGPVPAYGLSWLGAVVRRGRGDDPGAASHACPWLPHPAPPVIP